MRDTSYECYIRANQDIPFILTVALYLGDVNALPDNLGKSVYRVGRGRAGELCLEPHAAELQPRWPSPLHPRCIRSYNHTRKLLAWVPPPTPILPSLLPAFSSAVGPNVFMLLSTTSIARQASITIIILSYVCTRPFVVISVSRTCVRNVKYCSWFVRRTCVIIRIPKQIIIITMIKGDRVYGGVTKIPELYENNDRCTSTLLKIETYMLEPSIFCLIR